MAPWWEQIAAIPSFDDALQTASFFSEMQSTIHNMDSHSFDNNLQLARDVRIKLHTQINQGWHSIRLALCGGHYYKVTAPSSYLLIKYQHKNIKHRNRILI